MPVFGSSDALIRRRRRQRAIAVAAALALPAILAFLFEATHDPAYQLGAAMIACFEAVGFLLLPAIAPQGILTGERRGELQVDRTGVWFRKKLALPRDQIESVWVEEREEGGRFVHLAARKAKDDLAILVEDEKLASTLLEALDLRHDRHAAGFVVESAPLRTVTGQRLTRALVLLGGALLGGAVVYHAYWYALVGFALVPVLALYSMTLRRMRLTSRLVAGADGIVVRAGGVLRQIPFAGVRTVTRAKAEAVVELDTREALTLRFVGEGAEAKCTAFVSRVKRSIACLDRKPDPVAALLLPAATGGRGVQEWLAALRRITGGAVGYRGGAVPDEELWRIVENPGADAGARAGALAALRPRLDEIGRVRISELCRRHGASRSARRSRGRRGGRDRRGHPRGVRAGRRRGEAARVKPARCVASGSPRTWWRRAWWKHARRSVNGAGAREACPSSRRSRGSAPRSRPGGGAR